MRSVFGFLFIARVASDQEGCHLEGGHVVSDIFECDVDFYEGCDDCKSWYDDEHGEYAVSCLAKSDAKWHQATCANVSPIPLEYAVNLTVYHLNPIDAGAVPVNMDTGDAEGDLNFYLDEFLLPLECTGEEDFRAHFDCNNPERTGDLVVTKVEMQVDSRFTNYSACNYCDTGIDPISRRPCEIGKYICDCQGPQYNVPGYCDPTRIGVESPGFNHHQKRTCADKLKDSCSSSLDNATACNTCLSTKYQELKEAGCADNDLVLYCPVVDKCVTTMETLCGSVKKNASACGECRYSHSKEIDAAGCSQADAYKWCPSTDCSGTIKPGDEWKCWAANIDQKASGKWYSHPETAQCNETSAFGSCGWRVLSTSTVHEKCLKDSLATTIEAADDSSCFEACGVRNYTSPCWIGCFFDTMLGQGARNSSVDDAVTGLALEEIIAGWTKAFDDESDGGCPKVDGFSTVVV